MITQEAADRLTGALDDQADAMEAAREDGRFLSERYRTSPTTPKPPGRRRRGTARS